MFYSVFSNKYFFKIYFVYFQKDNIVQVNLFFDIQYSNNKNLAIYWRFTQPNIIFSNNWITTLNVKLFNICAVLRTNKIGSI